jgi:hypothetical protein
MSSRTTRVAALAGAAALVAIALTGCTASTSSPTTAPSAPGQLVVPTSVPNVPAERKNVQLASCVAAPGGWSASGTASNPGTASKTYAINVFFTNGGGTVVGVAATHVTVAPGKSAKWTTSAQIAAANGLSCVLRGVG